MRILLATDTYTPSVNGAAYFTKRLAEELAKRNHEVFVLCPSLSYSNTISEVNNVVTCRLRSINLPVYKNFRICPNSLNRNLVNKVVAEIGPDVIHIQNHFMIGKAVADYAASKSIPIVGTNHFMSENLIHYFHLPSVASNWLQNFAWKQCVNVFEKVNIVTTPTHIAARLLKSKGYSKDVHTISCGIDLKRFSPNNSGEHLKQLHRIPNGRKILLYVGRMDKEKNVDVIIASLKDVLLQNNVHLVLAGIGAEKNNLEKLTSNLNLKEYITFTGFVPDNELQNIYALADVFVIAGIAELQSIVTMEAMASGLPIIAANAMALPELVHDQENGYLFPPGDSLALSEKISCLLNNQKLARQMSLRSLEIIQSHEINSVINNYEKIYHLASTR